LEPDILVELLVQVRARETGEAALGELPLVRQLRQYVAFCERRLARLRGGQNGFTTAPSPATSACAATDIVDPLNPNGCQPVDVNFNANLRVTRTFAFGGRMVKVSADLFNVFQHRESVVHAPLHLAH
jgi:hypothetical protein